MRPGQPLTHIRLTGETEATVARIAAPISIERISYLASSG